MLFPFQAVGIMGDRSGGPFGLHSGLGGQWYPHSVLNLWSFLPTGFPHRHRITMPGGRLYALTPSPLASRWVKYEVELKDTSIF